MSLNSRLFNFLLYFTYFNLFNFVFIFQNQRLFVFLYSIMNVVVILTMKDNANSHWMSIFLFKLRHWLFFIQALSLAVF